MVTDTLTVGALAKAARVSVRTLHHYDAIGLLRPSARSDAGYRLYAATDLERLQQILFFRELGFPLAEISRIMLDPAFDRRRALIAQRALLAEKAHRAEAMLVAIDIALAATETGVEMDKDEMFEVFGKFDPKEYEEEVKRRWGDTDAYAESARRTARYTKDDWARIRAEMDRIAADLVEAKERGLSPGDAEVQAVIERHWRHLTAYFYTPTLEMYDGLADLYANDPPFTKNIDKAGKGLAAFQSAAMHSYVAARKA